LKELKTFCSFTGNLCFSSWGKWCRPIYMVPVLGLSIFLSLKTIGWCGHMTN